jgi:galactokinase
MGQEGTPDGTAERRKVRYHLTIPARINILGNPADGNEGDFATISAAVDLHAGASIEPAPDLILELVQRTADGISSEKRLAYGREQIPLAYDGQLDLLKGAINGLHRFSAEFRAKLAQSGAHLAIWTDVPRQSGLGGSSLFVLLALAGMRALYALDQQDHNDYLLAELAQRVEARELGITCGFSDRYVPLFGGIAYLDYRGKLHLYRPRISHRGLTVERA